MDNAANKHMHKHKHADLIRSFEDPARDEWQQPQKVMAKLRPLDRKKVIDIGSGSGYFTKYLLKENAYVTAADVDDKFLNYIQTHFSKKDYPRLETKKIEFNDPMMGKEKFDLAFTSNTYHHIDNRIEYFEKVRLGLKPEGKLAVLDFTPDIKGEKEFGPPMEMRISPDQVVKELSSAGFKKIHVITNLLDYQYLIIADK